MNNSILSFQNTLLPEISKTDNNSPKGAPVFGNTENNPNTTEALLKLPEKNDLPPIDFSVLSNEAIKSQQLIEPVALFQSSRIKLTAIEKNPTFADVKKGAVIELGQKSPAVKELQNRLSKLGFGIKATGEFGKNTEEVLKKFQKRYGLVQTGKFGPTSLTALETAENALVIGKKLAEKAKKVAKSRNTVGQCYNAVWSSIFVQFGDFLRGDSAYMAAGQFARNHKFKELKVQNSELAKLQPGAVVVWGKTPVSPHGHISISLGDGREASDHISPQLNTLRGYSNFRVFLPVKT